MERLVYLWTDESDFHSPNSFKSDASTPLFIACVAKPARKEWGVIVGRSELSRASLSPSRNDDIDTGFLGLVNMGKAGLLGVIPTVPELNHFFNRIRGHKRGFLAAGMHFKLPSLN